MSVLKIFGFDKTKHQLIDIADGVSTGILDTQKQVNLTVTEEEYKGRMYTKISRVSLPGTLIDQRRLTKAHAEELLQKIEAAYGSQPTAASAGAAAASDTSTSNEVPF